MPLYEYQCESCGSRFELIRKFSDPPVESCPTCQGPVRKLVSSPAFQFKGSGWYVTDYARKAEGTGSAKAGESAAAETVKKDSQGTKDSSSPAAEKPSTASTPASTEK